MPVNVQSDTVGGGLPNRRLGPGGDTGGSCGVGGPPGLDGDEAAGLAAMLHALADPVRLQMVAIIARSGEVCSCELEAPLARSQSTISHHTKVLAEAGLLVGEKRGRWVWWRIEPTRLAEVRQALGA